MVAYLAHFDSARSIRKIPSLLGFEQHPALHRHRRLGTRKHWTCDIVNIISVIYRVNIDDLFASYHNVHQDHMRGQRREVANAATAAAELQMSLGRERQVERDLMEADVLTGQLQDHIRAVADRSAVYSFPRDSWEHRTIDDRLKDPVALSQAGRGVKRLAGGLPMAE